ncbi:MAG: hypothetical protein JKY92_08950, partial [Magnetovibrio sp.]|nr:hypothetical protein [Magnetovibrio sp.]
MHLIALSNHMGKTLDAPSTKNDAPFPGDWRNRANALLVNPKLESLEGELLLDNLALDLRRRWLLRAHARSAAYLMSPPHKQIKLLPGDERISYPYDRWVRPEALERRLKARKPVPDGWVSDACVFSNGMAALTAFLQAFRAFGHDMWNIPKGPMSVHVFGGYFEISKALSVLCDQHFQGRKHASQQGLCKSVALGKTDLILIEPVTADIDLEVFDMSAFVKAFRQRPKDRGCVILFDTSLSGDVFPLEHFCKELGDHPPNLVANIRSGLKMDQEGLELSNLGLMTLWAPKTKVNQDQLL